MNTNIFICQMKKDVQNYLRVALSKHLLKEGLYSLNSLEEIMSERFEIINTEDTKEIFNIALAMQRG